MKHLVPARIKALQAELVAMGLDAAMIYDRENLIYFAGIEEMEGALAVPAKGEPVLFCLWLEADYIRKNAGIEKVVPFVFPRDSHSKAMAKWVEDQGWRAPRLGFTRYFVNLNDYLFMKKAAPDFVVEDIAAMIYKVRSVKGPEEISRMEVAAKALTAGMDAAFAAAAPGVREIDVLAEAEYAMNKAGSQGSTFRMQVLTKSRQQLMHPYASEAPLEADGPVVFHLGASYKGYVAKLCRTVFLGNPEPQDIKVYETLIRAQDAALKHLKHGMTCGELYDLFVDTVVGAGFEKRMLIDIAGYGIGIRQAEFYTIITKDSKTVIEENMAVGLFLPTIFRPKAGGPRITDVVIVGKEGSRCLVDYSKDIIIKK